MGYVLLILNKSTTGINEETIKMGKLEKLRKQMNGSMKDVNRFIQYFVSARNKATELKAEAKDSIVDLEAVIEDANTTIKVCEGIIK